MRVVCIVHCSAADSRRHQAEGVLRSRSSRTCRRPTAIAQEVPQRPTVWTNKDGHLAPAPARQCCSINSNNEHFALRRGHTRTRTCQPSQARTSRCSTLEGNGWKYRTSTRPSWFLFLDTHTIRLARAPTTVIVSGHVHKRAEDRGDATQHSPTIIASLV
eukprot:scaffold69597_cov31-Tisochrysis_lutea.AAC.1